ncbi:hypothetical protein J6590_038041 [Homalodisca vitripennis]|nr:hypothetical protein J6590_038041 [Homalodisca vitripennis]
MTNVRNRTPTPQWYLITGLTLEALNLQFQVQVCRVNDLNYCVQEKSHLVPASGSVDATVRPINFHLRRFGPLSPARSPILGAYQPSALPLCETETETNCYKPKTRGPATCVSHGHDVYKILNEINRNPPSKPLIRAWYEKCTDTGSLHPGPYSDRFLRIIFPALRGPGRAPPHVYFKGNYRARPNIFSGPPPKDEYGTVYATRKVAVASASLIKMCGLFNRHLKNSPKST